jgi:HEAT repeat protein
VRRGCARALGVIRAWLAVPSLIKALEDREVYVALAANNALQNITGVDFGVTQDTPASQRRSKAQSAEKWWEKNKDKPPEGVSLHPITD